jgi:hypothetical protein
LALENTCLGLETGGFQTAAKLDIPLRRSGQMEQDGPRGRDLMRGLGVISNKSPGSPSTFGRTWWAAAVVHAPGTWFLTRSPDISHVRSSCVARRFTLPRTHSLLPNPLHPATPAPLLQPHRRSSHLSACFCTSLASLNAQSSPDGTNFFALEPLWCLAPA